MSEAINVKVCQAGGAFGNVPMVAGATVAQVLRAAGVEGVELKQIRLNDGGIDSMDSPVHDGDTLYITPNIKGNS